MMRADDEDEQQEKEDAFLLDDRRLLTVNDNSLAATQEGRPPVQHSDSILSNSDYSEEDEETALRRQRQNSVRYMEEASMEASLLGSARSAEIRPAGIMGRRRTSVSESELITTSSSRTNDEEDSGEAWRFDESERSLFRPAPHSRRPSESQVPPPSLTANAELANEDSDNDMATTPSSSAPNTRSAAQILSTAGILPEPATDDATALWKVFHGFCVPQMPLETVRAILDLELSPQTTMGAVELPDPVTIVLNSSKKRDDKKRSKNTCNSHVVALLKAATTISTTKAAKKTAEPALLQLPLPFGAAFLRLLCRLLSGETDAEYNRACYLSLPWLDDSSRPVVVDTVTSQHRPYILYNAARLQCNWNEDQEDRPALLALLHMSERAADALIPALVHLFGLLAAGGVTPHVLRRMLSLAQQASHHNTARLAWVSALQTAAADSAQAPRHFFCFGGRDQGLTRTLTGLPTWPFRNDFGMACWFRAEHFDSERPVELLSARTDQGGGVQVSLVRILSSPIAACTIAVSVFDNNAAQQTVVRGCVLLPRVWYHVAIRHTRSRLKGVFSLSMREHVSIFLDGKIMLTEPLPFPQVSHQETSKSSLFHHPRRSSWSTRLNLHLGVAAGLDGETGTVYVFRDNVSDATIRALYETTALQRPQKKKPDWDSRRSDLVRQSRILDVKMTNEDAEEIVWSQKGSGSHRRRRRHAHAMAVVDVAATEEEAMDESGVPTDLQRAAFASKVYIAFDPRRVLGGTALELNAGAHVTLENVYGWSVHGAQDVIGSLGGIQALIPLIRSFLSADGEHALLLTEDGNGLKHQPIAGVFSTLLDLVSAFVKDHSGNARELLRCGGIDVIAELISGCKRTLNKAKRSKNRSLFGTVSSCRGLSTGLVESLLRLEHECYLSVALETKVFSRLVFNAPLWLDARARVEGLEMQSALFPVLSVLTRTSPDRVRDCVGVNHMIHALQEVLADISQDEKTIGYSDMQRMEVAEIILGMIFNVLASGSTPEQLSPFLNFISSALDKEWDGASRAHQEVSVRACIVLYLLLQIRPAVSGLFESFAESTGSFQSGAAWIICSMVNAGDDEIRSLGIRSIASYLDVTSQGADAALGLGSPLPPHDPEPPGTDVASNVLRASNRIGRLAKGLAAIGPATRVIGLSSSKLTPRVIFKLLWHFLRSQRYNLSDFTHTALLSLISDDNGILPSALSDHTFLKDHVLGPTETQQAGVRLCTEWAEAALAQTGHIAAKSLRNPLAIGTLLRLLRFFEDQQKDKWLDDLLSLCNSNRKCESLLASLPDWQPSLFQLVSDSLELVRAHSASEDGAEQEMAEPKSEKQSVSRANVEQRRLDVCLVLYSTLLGHLLREGGDKVRARIHVCNLGSATLFSLECV